MTRFGQDVQRGSQKWFQIAINQKKTALDAAIKQQTQLFDEQEQIEWRSPLKLFGYKEYRDKQFLDCLEIELLKRPLYSFWPRNGPLWDGLGRTSNGKLLLVEAKSHIPEMYSPSAQTSNKSLVQIQKSFGEVQKGLGFRTRKIDWSGAFYQYANRIAHLYLLRELNKLPAYLIFLCFLNDKEMNGPTSKEEWQGAIKLLETCLGLPSKHKLSNYILDVYLDISLLQ